MYLSIESALNPHNVSSQMDDLLMGDLLMDDQHDQHDFHSDSSVPSPPPPDPPDPPSFPLFSDSIDISKPSLSLLEAFAYALVAACSDTGQASPRRSILTPS